MANKNSPFFQQRVAAQLEEHSSYLAGQSQAILLLSKKLKAAKMLAIIGIIVGGVAWALIIAGYLWP